MMRLNFGIVTEPNNASTGIRAHGSEMGSFFRDERVRRQVQSFPSLSSNQSKLQGIGSADEFVEA